MVEWRYSSTILGLGIRPLYIQGKDDHCRGGWMGPKIRSGLHEEEKICLSRKSKSGHPACSLVAISTELSRLEFM
jgi:hypothetical protein